MINSILKNIVILVACLATISCDQSEIDKDLSLVSICDGNPELCSDLHQISDCRYKRTNLIRARYFDKIEPNQNHTVNLLDELDTYESCLELTLSMQFTRNKERKRQRVENYFKAQELMKENLQAIQGTQDPHLAYYLWTRHQDLNAKMVFLNAANQQELKDVKLLIKLATLYSKSDPQQALTLFYKALRESQSIEELPQNTFISIMTIFYQNRAFEEAYIWALLAKETSVEEELPINFDLILQKGLVNTDKQIDNQDILEEKADAYQQMLEKGNFTLQAPQIVK